MKFIILIILLVFCTTSDGIRCLYTTDESLMEIEVENLNVNAFFNLITNLPSKTITNTNLCRIAFYIEFSDLAYVSIKLTDDLIQSELNDSYVQIDIFVEDNEKDDLDEYQLIGYACSSDECDKKFLEKFASAFEWFLDAHYIYLSDILLEFIVAAEESPDGAGNYNLFFIEISFLFR